jgi:UDP-N-acetylmuramoylalanine--D-glutamate ligase
VSALLNLAPDHLDEHGSFEAYASAKARIFHRQGRGDTHVGNRDDAAAAERSSTAHCDVAWFRAGSPEEGEVGYDGPTLVARHAGRSDALGDVAGTPGLRADDAAAAASALAFGASPAAVTAGLASFEPAPHRGQVVAVVDDVPFIDDSKATNVHAALAAIGGAEDAVLIAGGRAKGVDLSPLARGADRLRAVVAIGEAAPELERVFGDVRPVRVASSIEEAVQIAAGLARRGGCVLLAPACASWDQFRDYTERGDRFAEAARALTREVSAGGR